MAELLSLLSFSPPSLAGHDLFFSSLSLSLRLFFSSPFHGRETPGRRSHFSSAPPPPVHCPRSLTRSTCTSKTNGSLSWLASCRLEANVGGCGPRVFTFGLVFEVYPADGGTKARRLEPGSAPARAESSPGTRSPVP